MCTDADHRMMQATRVHKCLYHVSASKQLYMSCTFRSSIPWNHALTQLSCFSFDQIWIMSAVSCSLRRPVDDFPTAKTTLPDHVGSCRKEGGRINPYYLLHTSSQETSLLIEQLKEQQPRRHTCSLCPCHRICCQDHGGQILACCAHRLKRGPASRTVGEV
jgi:hypothetical protein